MMDFNLPRPVRFGIYVGTSLASIVVTYLSAIHGISTAAVVAYSAAVTFVAGLAGYNAQK